MAKFPTVRTPTIEEVLDIADAFGMSISVDEAESFQGMMAGTIQSYQFRRNQLLCDAQSYGQN